MILARLDGSQTALAVVQELVNGVASWPDKVHSDSRQRQEFYDAGKGYYEIEPED